MKAQQNKETSVPFSQSQFAHTLPFRVTFTETVFDANEHSRNKHFVEAL